MEIPLQSQVECTDGVFGRSEYVLIEPVHEKVTHVVVSKAQSPHTEYMVPAELVSEVVAGTIQLKCSKADVEKMDPFIQKRYVKEKIRDYSGAPEFGGTGGTYFWPYASPDLTLVGAIEDEQVPTGETSIYRGTRVEATDGFVGHVDEFLVNPENDCITHLVMREGHLWGKKDVIIPISTVSDSNEETVRLKLNKQQIEALPTFPVRRRWG